jgi:hypothetical protein
VNNVEAVLKEKWYWILGGLAGIWLLFKLLGSSASSAGSSATVPAGVAVQYTGTTANDAAIQVAQLQNQSALAAQQIAMSQAVEQAQIALSATKDTNATNLGLAETQGRYALAITNNNNEAAKHASDNATGLGIVQSNNSATVAITQANNAYALGVDTNAANLKALENSNATQLAAYSIQGQVAQKQIEALSTVAQTVSNNSALVQTTAIQSAAELQAQRIAEQKQIVADTYNLERSGQLNKGGSGGQNQVSVWNAVLNPASAATGDLSAAQVAQVQATQLASVLNAIGGAVKNGLSTVFA